LAIAAEPTSAAPVFQVAVKLEPEANKLHSLCHRPHSDLGCRI